MSAALRQERDDAQNNARIHERDLVVLRADHRRLQDNFGRLTTRFADLAYRIQADHPEFQVFRLPGRRP
jgi:hypothetical protein